MYCLIKGVGWGGKRRSLDNTGNAVTKYDTIYQVIKRLNEIAHNNAPLNQHLILNYIYTLPQNVNDIIQQVCLFQLVRSDRYNNNYISQRKVLSMLPEIKG